MKIFYYLTCSYDFQNWYSQGFKDGINFHVMKFLVVSLSLFLLVIVISIILSYLEKRKNNRKGDVQWKNF